MIRSLFLPLICAALAIGGCSDIEDLDNFDVKIKQQVVIPAATPIELLLGDFPVLDSFVAFDLAQSNAFKNSGHDPKDVDSVVLESLVMTVAAPEGQDLSFFGEMTFTLESEGLEPLEIATLDNFPEGATSVTFNTINANIRDYVMASEATITVDVKDTQRPPQETTIAVEAVFDVDVNVF